MSVASSALFMTISEKMQEHLETHAVASLDLGGAEPVAFITDAVIISWVVMAFLMITAVLVTRKLKTVPGTVQSLFEWYVEFTRSFIKENIGHHYRGYVEYIAIVALFLLISNSMALFNIIPSFTYTYDDGTVWAFHGFPVHQPTKNINVCACLAIMSIVMMIYSEFKYKGLRGWGRSWYKPSPVNGFVKILDYVVRPLSLSLRLFGNMMGGFIVMGLLYIAFPWVVPAVVGIWFDFFDGILQAGVFAFLTTVYIAEAVE